MIDYISPYTKEPLIEKDSFLVSASGEKFPIIANIPRFVPENNYANAFGLQWKTFAKTQLDSFTKTNFSKVRLERCLGCSLDNLKNKNVLEVGCGAGRFTELLVAHNAYTHSVDLSNALESNKENIGDKPNYTIAQANVYHLPYPEESFDVVICLGFIQHTPDSEKTIKALWKMVKPGGLLVIDHNKWRIGYYTTPSPYFRFFLKSMPPEKSLKIVKKLVEYYFPLLWKFRHNKLLSWILGHLSPVIHNISAMEHMGENFNKETSILETYDQLTDFYKHLLTPKSLHKILQKLNNLDNIDIALGGNGIEARIKKKK
jgi:2-polyprenyl-3-methyl-5-hydroxy-6-metoxy-1,4-benzoquinol methylase